MTEEEKKRRSANLARKARHLAALGRPQRVLPQEFERALRILRKAHGTGMSMTQMAEQMGTAKSTVQYIMCGKRKTMSRATYDAILRLQPDLPERYGETRQGGAKMDPRTTTRRLQALAAAGWSAPALEPFIGIDARNLSNIITGRVGFVYAITKQEIATAYDKLQHMDPAAHLLTATLIGVRRSQAHAKRLGWAPPWCWDDDTIDDPEAHPEWTGACGTPEGYAIHIREQIPVCPACDDSVRKTSPQTGGMFSPAKFRILIEQRGLTVNEVAARAGCTDDSIRRWSAGERRPRPEFLAALASALDVSVADLLDSDDEEIFFDSDFNRGAFIATLEEKGMSKRQLSIEIGVSNMAVHYWITGKNTPKIPKMAKAAEVLGVDWKDWYR